MPDHTNDPFEPIDSELRSLADSAARSAHGVAPAEIRARGARRHRRRIGAVAVLATLAIVAVATVAVGASRDLAGDQVGPAAEGDTTALTDADLPAGSELPGFNEITGWKASDAYPTGGDGLVTACQQESLAGLGAEEIRIRNYRQTTEYPPGTTPDPAARLAHTGISIARFADEAAAQEAFETVRGWIEQCHGGGDAVHELGGVASDEGEGQAWLVTYPVEAGEPDIGVLDGEAVGVAGNRIVLIGQTQRGQDYNYPDGPTPIESALTIALDRLPPD